MKHLVRILSLGAAIVAAPLAHATTITAGQSGITPTAIAAGTQGTLLTSFTGTATASTFTASYTEYVYQGGINATCPTCLAFSVTVTDNTPTDVIQALTLSFFTTYTTNVDYVTGTGAVPSSVSRSATGNAVAYNFGAGFGPLFGSASTDQLIIFTNATNYNGLGTLALQDDSNVTVSNFMPAAATPEPSSLMLLGTGLVSAAGMLVRRRKIS